MSDSPFGLTPGEVLYSQTPIDLSKPYDESTVKGTTIVITGGASGIGEGMLRRFAPLGATVVIGDVNTVRGEALVKELRASTGNQNLHFVRVDVVSYPSQCAFFRSALALSPSGHLNTIIANAGVGEIGHFESPTGAPDTDPPEPPMATIDVNIKGAIFTARLALHHLKSTPPGQDRHLLFLGSLASFAAGPAMAVYSASKHAVLGFFRSLRLYPSARDGVRLNIVCPYFVDTPILPLGGRTMLAGLERALVEDVVEAAARLVCERGVMGRSLCVAPRGSGGVVEMGVGEMEEVEVFSRRIVRALNREAAVRSWVHMWWDLWVLFVVGPVVRLFGKH
ncbi:hypothetical protein DFP73DRAFT_476417 [Morchella snyderi]|nr:hypothetical protein DFP73DRAFT_476417 [Morchella snyderi]